MKRNTRTHGLKSEMQRLVNLNCHILIVIIATLMYTSLKHGLPSSFLRATGPSPFPNSMFSKHCPVIDARVIEWCNV